MKVLIADDSKVARKGVLKSLKTACACDFEHMEASNGQEAIDIFMSYKPDIIFMDLTMPEKNGMEALSEIKRMDNKAKVVIITADIQKRTTEMVYGLGAVEVLHKPVTSDKILSIVSKLING
jgi:DNA-binding NarL/FixJ family response regulator